MALDWMRRSSNGAPICFVGNASDPKSCDNGFNVGHINEFFE